MMNLNTYRIKMDFQKIEKYVYISSLLGKTSEERNRIFKAFFEPYKNRMNIKKKLMYMFFGTYLKTCGVIRSFQIHSQEFVVYPYPSKEKAAIFFLQKHFNTLFKSLVDITCVDYQVNDWRFEVVYILTSPVYNARIKIKVPASEVYYLDSISDLYEGAAWAEREVWEGFGIYFLGHPDLRRLLSDYGFSGYFLRKDFPLVGFYELFYSEKDKRIIQTPIQLNQRYRLFDFTSTFTKEQSKSKITYSISN